MTNTLSQQSEQKDNFHNKYITYPERNINRIEEELFKIFDEEVNAKNPVVIRYKHSMIYKMAQFIAGEIKRCVSVGIAGETASGKSTITYDIINTIELFSKLFNIGNLITRVNTDDYYYDRSEEVKKAGSMAEFAKNYDFDVPEALELDLMYKHVKELKSGKSVMLPKYDMSGTTIRWDNHTLANPSRIIISEGLFTLTEKVKDAFDFKIYVDINPEIQKERFFIRAKERNLGESAKSIYENASNKAEIYIRPTREDADIVLSGEAERKNYGIFLSKIIKVIEKIYFSKQV